MARLALLGLAAVLLLAAQEDFRLTKKNLPRGWRIEKEVEVPREMTDVIGDKLGGRIDRLVNQFLIIGGFRAQVNIVTCAGEEEADKIFASMMRIRGGDFVVRRGNAIVEFAGGNVLVAKRIRAAMGLAPGTFRDYEVAFRAACVGKPDYMEANRVFNLFIALKEKPDDAALKKRIAEITKDWTFGKSLRLRAGAAPHFEVSYRLRPEPWKTEKRGEVTEYFFEGLPEKAGVPYVAGVARVRVKDRFAPAGKGEAKGVTAATARWPAGSEDVKKIAARITRDLKTDRGRVLAILRYVYTSIRYQSPVLGSRYGVEQVLKQGFGLCWDKSDVFVTLCRAAGIPARQVAGWVPPLKSGHIWAEVLVGDEGWLPIDSTCPWVGVSEDYIPWYLTEDGEMPVVYLGMPVIKRVK
ncbi:MAG: transglutaminase-like domain-containing protein [Planctomycetota bacterium]